MTQIHQKFQQIISEISSVLLEREGQLLAIARAMLAGEHVLLLGPPGTGKSASIVEFMRRITGGKYFEILLTKFTAPEEMFGPISIQGLQEDKYERKVEGYLPCAHVGFVDEIWKAGSAILNSLLTIMVERKYKCGSQSIQAPLVSLICASNETPQDSDLGAMYDRFLLRVITNYVSPGNVVNLLRQGVTNSAVKTDVTLTLQEWEQARNDVRTITVTDDILKQVASLKAKMEQKGFKASDRRWKSSIKLLQACAYLDGRKSVEEDDLLVYSDVLWDNMNTAKQVADEVGKIVNPALTELLEHIDAIDKLLVDFVEAPNEQDRINAKIRINSHKESIQRLSGRIGAKGQEVLARIKEKEREAIKRIFAQ